ncbi:hypothetical protein ACQPXH_13425 [Nocardia sp. CA-135953]|uniref:hypothetical protein n=1 Tax=Nocardia sp. CA-135953 TaxID=3239978 RepID=UPI003D9583EA
MPAEPERVWQVLTAADALVSWARGITGVDWITPRPFGIGTRREVTVGRDAAALRERFYRWDVRSRPVASALAPASGARWSGRVTSALPFPRRCRGFR